MDFVAQATFRPDAHDVADYQHPDDKFGVDGGAAKMAVEGAQQFPQAIAVEEQIDLSQHMVGRDVPLQIELVEQLPRCFLSAHHPKILPSPHS